MPKVFKQTFLKPGRYCVGRDPSTGRKKFRNLTADELREFEAGTTAAMSAGYDPHIVLEHPEPNSDEGAPKPRSAREELKKRRDERAEELRNSVGWATKVKVGNDGAALNEFEIASPSIAKKINTGAIRFTSPELRESWTDGNGVTHRKVIAHFALTHKPRAIDQSPIVEATEQVPAMQFSLEDLSVQFADDDEEEGKTREETPDDDQPEGKKTDENPDLPDASSDDAKQFEALLVLIKEVWALDLPADTTPENLVRTLLTAVKTYKATKDAITAENETAEQEEGDEVEERPPIQFSLSDTQKSGFGNKLLARLAAAELAALTHKLGVMVGKAKISELLRDKLLERGNSMQFSADGDVLDSFKLTDVVAMLDECTYDGQALDSVQLSSANEVEHPSGTEFREGEGTMDPGPAAAAAYTKKLKEEHPGHFAKSA